MVELKKCQRMGRRDGPRMMGFVDSLLRYPVNVIKEQKF